MKLINDKYQVKFKSAYLYLLALCPHKQDI